VAAGAGGDAAAERGELERLREVPERVPVRSELLLDLRTERAGLDAGGAGRRVDLQHPAHLAQIDRAHALEAGAHVGLDAPHDAGAAAEGDRGKLPGFAPGERR